MITLTTNAVTAIKAALSRAAEVPSVPAAGLRVVAQPATGRTVRYLMHLDAGARAGDLVIEQSGLKVFIDGASRAVADEICIDFVESATARGFVFASPAADVDVRN